MPNGKQLDNQRLHLAQTAAWLMHEQGIRDFRIAKAKAAEHLRVDVRRVPQPSNTEIESALAEHLRLFGGDDHSRRLAVLRRAAAQAMRLFAEFRPRLVGDVLSGLASPSSDVQLHLFAEHSETFDLFLGEQGIPFELGERRFRFGGEAYHYYPAFRFAAGDVGIEAVVFPSVDIRQAPRSLIDGAPMRRATLAEVEALVEQERRLD